MEAKELRIGNLIQDKDGNIEVVNKLWCDDIFERVNDMDISYYKPILLSEEWLVKSGFGSKYGAFIKNGIRLLRRNAEFNDLPVWRVIINELDMSIYFIHQLQNLYFALTGKELETK